VQDSLQTIPARKGVAVRLMAGDQIKVINTHGTQVIDTWAFNAEDMDEFMSMEHSRTHLLRTIPLVGDSLRTNRRKPILTVVADTSGGVHDTLVAACDKQRYALLGHPVHDNCTDNLAAGLRALELKPPEVPCPLNLFMNVPVQANGAISFEPPVSPPGSFISLRAEMDLVIVFSACPQDITPVNGAQCLPTEAHFVVERAQS
jgi:uncharacterized protein YcgI (DUF1989 family)